MHISEADLAQGSLYPPLNGVREVSAQIAAAVAEVAYRDGLAEIERPDDLVAFMRVADVRPDVLTRLSWAAVAVTVPTPAKRERERGHAAAQPAAARPAGRDAAAGDLGHGAVGQQARDVDPAAGSVPGPRQYAGC